MSVFKGPLHLGGPLKDVRFPGSTFPYFRFLFSFSLSFSFFLAGWNEYRFSTSVGMLLFVITEGGRWKSVETIAFDGVDRIREDWRLERGARLSAA